MGISSFRFVLVALFACLALLAAPRAALASSAGVANQWGFNSSGGCMICHTNGVGTSAALETSFSPAVLTFAFGSTTKLTITVNVGNAVGAAINVTAFSTTGGNAAGSLSTCNPATDSNCGGLKTIGSPAQITHTSPHPKGAGNLVSFAFNYTAPTNPAGGCYADKLEIWINDYNGNGNNPGDQARRFDHVVSSVGFGCPDDGNVCTTEACNAAGQCVHSPGNAGTLCRAAAGVCDVAEVCNGTSAGCPVNVFVPAGTQCRAGTGPCDAAETCTGSSAACPPDSLSPAGTTCRAAAGPCDNPETCTGASAACPPDTLKLAGSLCRAAVSVCDLPETCTGGSVACPADIFAPAGIMCRPSAGVCDVAESCTGVSGACPPDTFLPSTTPCRASAGICDVAESCTGSAAACPADALAPSGTLCRAAASACDAAEVCTGASTSCPADAALPAGTVCSNASCSAGSETHASVCTGAPGACPAPVVTPCNGYVCGAAACLTSCTTQAQCASGFVCVDGACKPPVDLGDPCTSSAQCGSGFCADGVCCDTACTEQCGACNVAGKEGVCSPVIGAPKGGKAPCASDGSLCGGTCDGSTLAGCAYPGGTVECRAGSCDGSTATLAASCDGQGACPAVMTQACGVSGCGPTMCIGDCVVDQDCDPGEFCAAGVCTLVKPNGAVCGGASQCGSGVCIDGVCCGAACDGQCEACDVAGQEGTCQPVTGNPRGGRPACGGSGVCSGTCDGENAGCTFPGATVSCGEATCGDGVATAAPACRGDGTCGAGEQKACATCDGNVCAPQACEDEDCVLSGGCACDLVVQRRPGAGALAMLALGLLVGVRASCRRRPRCAAR